MDNAQNKKNLKRLKELRHELFNMANSYAGDATGNTAVKLHGACNHLLTAIQAIESGVQPDITRELIDTMMGASPFFNGKSR